MCDEDQPGSAGAAERLRELAEAAIRALGIERGVTHVEVKLTPDGPRLIEVNGRMGGYVGALLRRATGFDLLCAALLSALSLPVPIPEPAFPGVEFVYFVTAPAHSGSAPTGIRGLQRVAALEDVWQVAVDERPVRRAHWREGTEGHFGTVHGRSADHDRLRAALAAIGAAITFAPA